MTYMYYFERDDANYREKVWLLFSSWIEKNKETTNKNIKTETNKIDQKRACKSTIICCLNSPIGTLTLISVCNFFLISYNFQAGLYLTNYSFEFWRRTKPFKILPNNSSGSLNSTRRTNQYRHKFSETNDVFRSNWCQFIVHTVFLVF